MNRRSFLGLLAGAAAAEAGRKYFFAPVGGWQKNPQGLWAREECVAGGMFSQYDPAGGFPMGVGYSEAIYSLYTYENKLFAQNITAGQLKEMGLWQS